MMNITKLGIFEEVLKWEWEKFYVFLYYHSLYCVPAREIQKNQRVRVQKLWRQLTKL